MNKRTEEFLERISSDAHALVDGRRHLTDEDREAIMNLFYGIQREIGFELVKRDLLESDFFDRVKAYIDVQVNRADPPQT